MIKPTTTAAHTAVAMGGSSPCYVGFFQPNVWIIIAFSCYLLQLATAIGDDQFVGINYGRVANNLPTAEEVAMLVQSTLHTNHVKIFDADDSVLHAFANTNISLTICVPNEEIPDLGSSPEAATQWIQTHVLPFLPSTRITAIAVGNEILTPPYDPVITAMLVPAMINLNNALVVAGVRQPTIRISSPHALSVLTTISPPSAGEFDPRWAIPVIKPMLEFLSETNSPFMINLYPYLMFNADRGRSFPLEYALMTATGFEHVDPVVGLRYTNLLDALVDAVFSAMAALGHEDVSVVVSETGWPTKGDENEKGANALNARIYNQNLICHLLADPPKGTPSKPGISIPAFIFALFNENEKPGAESERNWGMFYPNMTKVYDVDLMQGAADSAPDLGQCL